MRSVSKPIKVCFVCPKAYPLFNPDVKKVFGGAEVDLYFLATELGRDKNFAVSFISADYGQRRFETIENVRIIKTVDFNKNALTGAVKIWRGLRRAGAQIYFQETASWGMFLIGLFCRLQKRILVYRTPSTKLCDGTFFKGQYFLGKVFRWVLRTAKCIIVQNESDRENLTRTTGITPLVIPNAHRLKEAATEMRNSILWVGRSSRVKRPDIFIDLVERVPTEHFTMICQHATDDRNYKDLMARAGKVRNLQFVERVPFDEIDSYFLRAKVLVNTSSSEGFPNTFIQACKCGTPILSLKVNPDDFLTTYKCGLCADGDWGKFLEQFEFLAGSQEARDYGMNGRRYAEEKHNIEEIIEEYKRLFFALAGNSSSNNNHTDQSD